MLDFPAPPLNRTGWPWTERIEPYSCSDSVALSWPKVTIVTPSFNQGQFLEETIRSVLLQEYPNLEYIIIDGGSSDNSVDIIRKYEPWLSYWVSEPDKGQADAINKGFEKSTGAYLGWLNSDDYLYPDAIKRVMEVFQADSTVEMIYGDINQGWPAEQKSRRLCGKQMEFTEILRTLQVPIPQQGSLWKRSVVEQVGKLDSKWQVILDHEFFIRIIEKCHIRYLPGILGFFRFHEDSKSISQRRQWLIELPKMYQEFFARKDLQKTIKSLNAETMGAVFLTCTFLSLRCRELTFAFEYVIKAFKIDPLFLFRRCLKVKLIRFFRTFVLKQPHS